MASKRRPTRTKTETSKLFAWAALLYLFAATSAVLALDAFNVTLSDNAFKVITVTQFLCTSIVGGYLGKSGFEKNSRNKYGVDESGQPYEPPTT